jgi:transmembrane sensor
MKHNQEYIYALLLRKQLGELSEVEAATLQQVIQQDEHVRKCYQEQEEAKYYTNNEILKDLRIEHDWLMVEAILKPKPLHTRVITFLRRHSVAAAASTLIIAGVASAMLYKPSTLTPMRHIVAVRSVPVMAAAIVPLPVQMDTIAVVAAPAIDSDARAIKIPHITHDTIYQSKSIEWNTLTVPPKTDYRLDLADGTEVHLNASSTLRFPFIFAGSTREVYLEGEAFFTVAHDPAHPFIVHTGTTSIIALGTKFNVNSYDNNLITTSLVNGSVVTDVGDSLDVTLKPGFEAIYKPGERFTVKRFDEHVTLGWRDGIFRYVDRPLDDLAPVMMRWFGLRLQFENKAMARQTFTGDLEKDKPVDEFLSALCKERHLDFHIYGGTVYFSTPIKKKDLMED